MTTPFLSGLTAGSNMVNQAMGVYEREQQRKAQQAVAQQKMQYLNQALAERQQAQSTENVRKDQAAQDLHNKMLLEQKYHGIFSNNPDIFQAAQMAYASDQAANHPEAMDEDEANNIASVTGKHPITGETVPVTKSPESLYGQQATPSSEFTPQLPSGDAVDTALSDMGQTPTSLSASSFAPGGQEMPQQAPGQQAVSQEPMPQETIPHQFSEDDTLSDIQKLVANNQVFSNSARLKMPDTSKNIIPPPNFTASANTVLGNIERSNYARLKQKLEPSVIKQQYANAMAWRALDAPDKARDLAYAAGMGIDPTSASKFFTKGGTTSDMAQQLGYNLSNIRPNYAPVTKTLGSEQQQNLAIAAMRPVEKNITNWLAPYTKRFAGYSLKNISQQISGDSPDDQAKFFAAYTLMPELMAARTRALQGTFGEGFYQSAKEASVGKLKAMRNLMTPEIWRKSQEYVQQTFDASINAARNNLNTFGQQSYKDIYMPSVEGMGMDSSAPSKSPTESPITIPDKITKEWYNGLSAAQRKEYLAKVGAK